MANMPHSHVLAVQNQRQKVRKLDLTDQFTPVLDEDGEVPDVDEEMDQYVLADEQYDEDLDDQVRAIGVGWVRDAVVLRCVSSSGRNLRSCF